MAWWTIKTLVQLEKALLLSHSPIVKRPNLVLHPSTDIVEGWGCGMGLRKGGNDCSVSTRL